MQKRNVLAVIPVALLVVGPACGGGSEEPTVSPKSDAPVEAKVYDANGVTFEYPGDWDEAPAKIAATSSGSNELWAASVGPDKTNLVNIIAYRLNIRVTEDNLDKIESELDELIQGVVDEAGGEITDGPTASEVAGFPAYTYTWEGVEVAGEPKDSSAYFLFDGKTEYFFNCQFSDEVADEVLTGCAEILGSFSVTNAR